MKARTKLQLRVTGLSKQLPRITESQEEWAKRECLMHRGYATKNRVLCMDCGNSFSSELLKRQWVTCPHCQTRIIVTASNKRTDKQRVYFAIADVVEDFQVVSFYELVAFYKGGKPASFFCREILEHWILPDGKREVIGRIRNFNYYQDSWSGDWSIRKKEKKFDVYPKKYHPASKFKAEYRKYGINSKLAGLTLLEAIKIVPNDPKAETLLKAKRYDLLQIMEDGDYYVRTYWASVKVCLRNKYKPFDVNIWFDYLQLLRYFNKDLHNAKYVCPEKLEYEHNRLVAKKREIQKRRELERKRREIAEAQIHYAERIKPFAGLQFSDGMIVVKVLEDVKEFEQEGDILKHCVFTNDYYTKEDSLILSARIDGVPVETIEVSLTKMKINQSRGLQNQPSEYNKKIVSLVRKNLSKIKKLHLQKIA